MSRNTLILMRPDGHGGLTPASVGEIALAVDAWPEARVHRMFGPGGPGIPTNQLAAFHGRPGRVDFGHYGMREPHPGELGYPDTELGRQMVRDPNAAMHQVQRPRRGQLGVSLVENPGIAAALQSGGFGYQAPGNAGAVPPRGKGIGSFGAHLNTTGGTTATSTTNSPERPVFVNRLNADGPAQASNWVISSLQVNLDILKHGGLMPAQVLSPLAAHPIPFALNLGTQDNVTIASHELVNAGHDAFKVSGETCFDARCGLDFPCEAMGKGSRQIILGLGATQTSVADANASVATMSDSPDTPIRLGALVLQAAFGGTPVGAGGISDYGVTPPGDGQPGLGWIRVTQFNVNGIEIFTTVPSATASAIPGSQFSAFSSSHWMPDYVVTQADTINVLMRNDCPAPATSGDNDLEVVGAIIGAERLATC